MGRAPATSRWDDAPDPVAAARRGAVTAWLLVPLIALLGAIALTAREVPMPGETLMALAADPGFLADRIVVSIPNIGPAWTGLTLAGLAAGMTIFLLACGLTLVFGLTGTVSFAHGAVIALGAFVALRVAERAGAWGAPSDPALALGALGALCLAALAALAVAGSMGALVDRAILRPLRGSHRGQVVAGVGVLIVANQMLGVEWRGDLRTAEPRAALADLWPGLPTPPGAGLDTVQGLALLAGIAAFVLVTLTLRWTRIGLVLRAGMDNGELVVALGYRLGAVATGVSVAGAALAGLGGLLWALDAGGVTARMSMDVLVPVFAAVLIGGRIGGRGSVTGCFIGAVAVGLTQTYAAALNPALAPLFVVALLLALLARRGAGPLPVSKAQGERGS